MLSGRRGPLAAIAAALVIVACGVDEPGPDIQVSGSDADRGHELVDAYGCAACHDLPGIDGPGGNAGPPLGGFGDRATIAGRFPNTPDNLVAWLRDPQALDPGVDMPDLDIDQRDAADIAAYLLSLR